MNQETKAKSKNKYAKRISLYPMKAEKVLSAFMKVDPKKVIERERKAKNKHK